MQARESKPSKPKKNTTRLAAKEIKAATARKTASECTSPIFLRVSPSANLGVNDSSRLQRDTTRHCKGEKEGEAEESKVGGGWAVEALPMPDQNV